jgi:hypothetical protein
MHEATKLSIKGIILNNKIQIFVSKYFYSVTSGTIISHFYAVFAVIIAF